jgi:hypothetical protein
MGRPKLNKKTKKMYQAVAYLNYDEKKAFDDFVIKYYGVSPAATLRLILLEKDESPEPSIDFFELRDAEKNKSNQVKTYLTQEEKGKLKELSEKYYKQTISTTLRILIIEKLLEKNINV